MEFLVFIWKLRLVIKDYEKDTIDSVQCVCISAPQYLPCIQEIRCTLIFYEEVQFSILLRGSNNKLYIQMCVYV